MEFSVPGFIKKCCSPNAILTLAEYIEDYAGKELAKKGYMAIERGIQDLDENIASKYNRAYGCQQHLERYRDKRAEHADSNRAGE